MIETKIYVGALKQLAGHLTCSFRLMLHMRSDVYTTQGGDYFFKVEEVYRYTKVG